MASEGKETMLRGGLTRLQWRIDPLLRLATLRAVLGCFLIIPFCQPVVDAISALTGLSFDFLCGQRVNRALPVLAHTPWLLCARCTAICFGVGLGALGLWFFSLPRAGLMALLCLSGVCLGLDWLTEALRMRADWLPLRVATGLCFGYLSAVCALNPSGANARQPPVPSFWPHTPPR